MTSSLTRDVARAVAVRRDFVSSAISPSQSPPFSSPTLRPPCVTSTFPSTKTKNSCADAPSFVSTVPSRRSTSSAVAASSRSSAFEHPRAERLQARSSRSWRGPPRDPSTRASVMEPPRWTSVTWRVCCSPHEVICVFCGDWGKRGFGMVARKFAGGRRFVWISTAFGLAVVAMLAVVSGGQAGGTRTATTVKISPHVLTAGQQGFITVVHELGP